VALWKMTTMRRLVFNWVNLYVYSKEWVSEWE
jgi:hypothetical protein